MIYRTLYNSPIGIIEIKGTETYIRSLKFIENETESDLDIPEILNDCKSQLEEYFNGKRKQFTINIQQDGTEFQQKVWETLMKIPFGQTVSYLDIAKMMGDEKSVRAVGHANGKNQLWIIVPCHRVIGSNGSLTGYAGKIWRKKWLLQHEFNIENDTLVLR